MEFKKKFFSLHFGGLTRGRGGSSQVTGVGSLDLGRESGVGSRESGVGSQENYSVIIVYLDTYLNRGVFLGRLSAAWNNYSDASQ